MAYVRRFSVTITTDGSGDGTGYIGPVDTAGNVGALDQGWISSIQYVKPGASSYTDGVDIVITGETTGMAILTDANMNASETFFPRQTANGASDGAVSSDNSEPILIANERIKIVVSSGGASKVGTFFVTIG